MIGSMRPLLYRAASSASARASFSRAAMRRWPRSPRRRSCRAPRAAPDGRRHRGDHDVLPANTTLNLVRAPCAQQIAFTSAERKTVMASLPPSVRAPILPICSSSPRLRPPRSVPSTSKAASSRPRSSCAGCFPPSPTPRRPAPVPGPLPAGSPCPSRRARLRGYTRGDALPPHLPDCGTPN